MTTNDDDVLNDDIISLEDLILEEEQDEEDVDGDDDSGANDVGGSSPGLTTDDDTEGALEEVIGTNVTPGKPFSLAEEIEQNELKRRGIDLEDLESDE